MVLILGLGVLLFLGVMLVVVVILVVHLVVVLMLGMRLVTLGGIDVRSLEDLDGIDVAAQSFGERDGPRHFGAHAFHLTTYHRDLLVRRGSVLESEQRLGGHFDVQGHLESVDGSTEAEHAMFMGTLHPNCIADHLRGRRLSSP